MSAGAPEVAPHVVSCTPVGAWLRGAWLEELGAVLLCLPVRCEGLRPHSLPIIPLSSTFLSVDHRLLILFLTVSRAAGSLYRRNWG